MLYLSEIQFPRSIALQRSLQKGRNGFCFNDVALPHRGHWTFIMAKGSEPLFLPGSPAGLRSGLLDRSARRVAREARSRTLSKPSVARLQPLPACAPP
jgi:hypothetical protein